MKAVTTVDVATRHAQGLTDSTSWHTRHDKELPAMDWRHRSACLDEDPELFFPIGNTGPAILQIEEAKQVCRRCEVREQCLAWAARPGRTTESGAG